MKFSRILVSIAMATAFFPISCRRADTPPVADAQDRPALAYLSYGDGMDRESDRELNTLVLANIGDLPCEDIVYSFDLPGWVDRAHLSVRSDAAYSIRSEGDSETEGKALAVHFPAIAPGQMALIQYEEKYIVMESVKAIGQFPRWNLTAPGARLENLAADRAQADALLHQLQTRHGPIRGKGLGHDTALRPDADRKPQGAL